MRIRFLALFLLLFAVPSLAQDCIPERERAVIAYDEANGMPAPPANITNPSLGALMAWRRRWRADNNVKPMVNGQWICGTPEHFKERWI